jgi:hypothetical protein
MEGMRLVILESPYAGSTQSEIDRNIVYGRKCLRDSLLRGEAPIASHLLYTQDGVLRDDIHDERSKGIKAGLEWAKVACASVVYIDHGISSGMKHGIKTAEILGVPIEYRKIEENL